MALPSGLTRRVRAAQASLPWRAWTRYGKARGGVLAGGMAYVAFFSLLPALAVGFTVFGLVVGNRPDLQAKVIKSVNDSVGTVIISPPNGTGGIVSIDTLTGSTQLTWVGIIGLIGFLLTGLGWLDALREGIRAMFGQPTLEGNVVKTKARDLLVLASIGLVLLASAVAGIVVNAATGWILDHIGLSGSLVGGLVVGGVSTLLLLGVDILVFLLLFRLLSGVPVANGDLWDAALFGGVGLGILKLLSSVLLKSAHNNKFLATAGVFLALLVWLNLVSRLTLVAAAWGATVAIDRGHLVLPEGGGLPQTAFRSAAEAEAAAAAASGSRAGSGSGSAGSGSAGSGGRTNGSARGSRVEAPPGPARTGAATGSASGRPPAELVGAGTRSSSNRTAGPSSGSSSSRADGDGRTIPRPSSPTSRPGGPAGPVPFTPVVSPRGADRISVAAGAVLGAASLYAFRSAVGAARSLIDSARRSD